MPSHALRTKLAVGTAAVALTATGAVAAPAQGEDAAPAAPDAVWQSRASSTYDALQDHLYTGAAGHGLYHENADTSSGNPYSFLWEYREAAQAAVDLAGLPGAGAAYTGSARARVDGFQHYYAVAPGGRAGYESYLPAPLGTGGDVYYDDNAVVGLTYVSEFLATHEEGYLDDARAAFDIAVRSWDTDTSASCPGGSDWIDRPDNTVRAANVTGLTAQLAAHLYEQTADSSYLRWSVRLYRWNARCLEQSPGLYRNSIGDDGTIDPTLWTYNSGAMIATAALLFRATGDPAYLTRARRDAKASLAYWQADGRLQQQPAIFNAFYFRDLLLLDSVQHDPAYRAVAESYATNAWRENRDASTGLFRFQASGGGDYDADRPAATLDQAAMIQIFALLGWSTDRLGRAG